MAKLRKKKNNKFLKEALYFLLLVILLFLDICVVSFNPGDPAIKIASGTRISNWGGKFGAYCADLIFLSFGILSYFLFPLITLIWIFSPPPFRLFRISMIIASSIFLSPLLGGGEDLRLSSGFIGHLIYTAFKPYIGRIGIAVLFIPIGYMFLTLGIGSGPVQLIRDTLTFLKNFREGLRNRVNYMRSRREREKTVKRMSVEKKEIVEKFEIRKEEPVKKEKREKTPTLFDTTVYKGKFLLPPIDLLNLPPPRETGKEMERAVQEQASLLLKKLKDFSIEGRIVKISPGPLITMYEFEPAPGIKISKIVSLAEDLALGMRARSVRIVGHLSGKSAVGIEVANPVRENVFLREIIDSEEFRNNPSPLTIALGKDTVGNPFVTELTRFPHLLIAGATGSGKSVAMHALIMSILFKSTPEDVRLLLIDPKMLEFNEYNGIPHLLHQVIFEPKEASNALKWLVEEMERRYKILKEYNVRDIRRFNKLIEKMKKTEEKLPHLVVFIDELADLMMISPRDVEESIKRLSQMARAAGMHLVVATQRPSVDVITGVIKANFPARIALQVSSKVDSRTIIDMGGAESLLGMGDMLFLPPGSPKPIRVHGAYVSEEEVASVCNFLKKQAPPQYIEEIVQAREIVSREEVFDEDEKFQEALEIVKSVREVSISFLQRKLKIGFNRAANIIEKMAEKGIIEKVEGSSGKQWRYKGD